MAADAAVRELETERLVLRPQRVEDAGVFRQLWTERDPRVPPHRQLSADGRPTLEDIAMRIRAGDEPVLLTVVRKHPTEVIGYCGLVFHGTVNADEPEIAFELLSCVHNLGYATEAAGVVLDWARSGGYPRVWASVWSWNLASLRVLEKLGFQDADWPNFADARPGLLLRMRKLE